ncbi:GL17175 [Drosophila persimilis]|uniref:Pre-mRNA-splicing factor Syf2 n=3 Tax=pseudoobscura subgroup TaxID=32358 RepID=SYF2_DROPS|nr:pre-mRNA-splicing factor Syf2 [Drosophila pseudoobscura]XP_002017683.1 pre-mRNA-splicing factor Syf2 [Drosophila persimilis]Q28XK6.1 RecName: Full=Pre-mRNA-splicing factor Syf2 [Drosophila pseudoobscura pseudoobscura]EDW35522.1 GL17175 [Drosophila persimilis]
MEQSKSASDKLAERKARLLDLHKKRQEARTDNHQEVVAEDARKKLPKNWEARKRQAEWLLADDKAREDAQAAGKDYERLKLLEVSAIDAERIEKKKKRKDNPDLGFSTYEAQTARQYSRLVKGMPARDMEKYEKQKAELGEAFYGGPHTTLHALTKDTPAAINKMVNDLDQQIERRKKYSRRRIYNDDADVDFINERNSKFNKKLDRFYGEHTAEIKQNLERGTAI